MALLIQQRSSITNLQPTCTDETLDALRSPNPERFCQQLPKQPKEFILEALSIVFEHLDSKDQKLKDNADKILFLFASNNKDLATEIFREFKAGKYLCNPGALYSYCKTLTSLDSPELVYPLSRSLEAAAQAKRADLDEVIIEFVEQLVEMGDIFQFEDKISVVYRIGVFALSVLKPDEVSVRTGLVARCFSLVLRNVDMGASPFRLGSYQWKGVVNCADQLLHGTKDPDLQGEGGILYENLINRGPEEALITVFPDKLEKWSEYLRTNPLALFYKPIFDALNERTRFVKVLDALRSSNPERFCQQLPNEPKKFILNALTVIFKFVDSEDEGLSDNANKIVSSFVSNNKDRATEVFREFEPNIYSYGRKALDCYCKMLESLDDRRLSERLLWTVETCALVWRSSDLADKVSPFGRTALAVLKPNGVSIRTRLVARCFSLLLNRGDMGVSPFRWKRFELAQVVNCAYQLLHCTKDPVLQEEGKKLYLSVIKRGPAALINAISLDQVSTWRSADSSELHFRELWDAWEERVILSKAGHRAHPNDFSRDSTSLDKA